MSVSIVSTGNWEIDTDNLIKVEGMPKAIEENTGARKFPYIAIPFSATILEEEVILYWGESHSLPEDRLFDGGQYRVYQVRTEYVKHLAEDLFKAKGFFLVREGCNDGLTMNMMESESEKEDRCCVCGHKLSEHVDESDGWRCHALGSDLYQCECFLRKDRADGNVMEYSLERRMRQHKKEFEEGFG